MRLTTILSAALLVLLSACASPTLRLYDGAARPAAERAQIVLPEEIEAARLNGQALRGASGNWTHGAKTLEVLPGRYELLAYYREIWVLGDQHDVLRSNPVLLVIDAEAGGRYTVDYARPPTYAAARELAARFSAWSQGADGQRHASQPSGLRFRDGLLAQVSGGGELVADEAVISTTSVAPIIAPPLASPPASAVSVPPAAAPVTATKPATGSDWLSLMQGWWQQASAEERRAFLRWVAEQPAR